MKKAVLLTMLMFSSFAFTQSQVPSTFWGIQFNQMNSTYPVPAGPTFQTVRFWDTGTAWVNLQTGSSAYDFTHFNNWMETLIADYGTQSFDVIYTLGKTPGFESWDNTHQCNGKSQSQIPYGSCLPPKDVTCSGIGVAGTGGTDATLIGFIEALWVDITNNGWASGRHWYIETWNEPNNPTFWDSNAIINNTTYCNGDVTAPRRILARMSADVRGAIQSASQNVSFLTPPPSSTRVGAGRTWWQDYLSGDGNSWGLRAELKCSGYGGGSDPCGGGQFADVMSVHGYLNASNDETPDDVCCDSQGSDGNGTAVYNTLEDMNSYGQISKPLFVTEGSWGTYCNPNSCPQPGIDPVAYTGRYYTLLASQAQTEVQRFAWYNYDTLGPFWCSTEYDDFLGCAMPPPTGLSTSGVALTQMQSVWGYDGGTFTDTGGCQKTASLCASGNYRTCDLNEGGNGTRALVAWYDGASGSSCSYTPPPPGPNLVWKDYRDLYGNYTGYSTGSVLLSNSPILFESTPSN